MSDNIRHETICSFPKVSNPISNDYQGRLLQIHPVDLGSGLITIDDEGYVVGRDQSSDLTIPEQAVSRKHARFEKTAAGYTLTDLKSTNGTWVNENKTETCLLQSGDRIRIGTRIFKFISTDKVEAQYHEAVYSMMTKDSLTGAWNKRYFKDMLSREMKRRARTERPLSLLMFDLDNFKTINDGHGHLVGDEVLAQMSKRILDSIREEDIFARFGGEEFCVVLVETDLESAKYFAERCRSAIGSTPMETEAGPLVCTASVGIGSVDGADNVTPDQLIKMADDKLYLAKTLGRNRVEV